MTLTVRLRILLTGYAALLALALGLHIRALVASRQREQQLARTAERIRLLSQSLGIGVDDMDASAAKYDVTRDTRYLERLRAAAAGFSAGLRRVDPADLAPVERAWHSRLDERWRSAAVTIGRLDSTGSTSTVQPALEGVRDATLGFADAAQQAMADELTMSAASASRARVVSSILAVTAVVASLALLAVVSRLDELDRMKRAFLSRVSHDLKTPLTSMQETVDVLLDEIPGPLTPVQRRLLLLNRESSGRLYGMLTKLLEASRRESLPRNRHATFDLSAAARRCVERLNAAARSTGIARVRCALPDALLIEGDEDAVAQLIENLLENALKFSPAESSVLVGASRDAGLISLFVADHGPGVPDSEKQRIFRPFHQGARGRDVPARGVGLGLSICHHIAREHHATVTVEDNVPHGAIFRITFPTASRVSDARVLRVSAMEGAA